MLRARCRLQLCLALPRGGGSGGGADEIDRPTPVTSGVAFSFRPGEKRRKPNLGSGVPAGMAATVAGHRSRFRNRTTVPREPRNSEDTWARVRRFVIGRHTRPFLVRPCAWPIHDWATPNATYRLVRPSRSETSRCVAHNPVPIWGHASDDKLPRGGEGLGVGAELDELHLARGSHALAFSCRAGQGRRPWGARTKDTALTAAGAAATRRATPGRGGCAWTAASASRTGSTASRPSTPGSSAARTVRRTPARPPPLDLLFCRFRQFLLFASCPPSFSPRCFYLFHMYKTSLLV